jgi:hypothetical protein
MFFSQPPLHHALSAHPIGFCLLCVFCSYKLRCVSNCFLHPVSSPTIVALHLAIVTFSFKMFYSFWLQIYPVINFITVSIILCPSLHSLLLPVFFNFYLWIGVYLSCFFFVSIFNFTRSLPSSCSYAAKNIFIYYIHFIYFIHIIYIYYIIQGYHKINRNFQCCIETKL